MGGSEYALPYTAVNKGAPRSFVYNPGTRTGTTPHRVRVRPKTRRIFEPGTGLPG